MAVILPFSATIVSASRIGRSSAPDSIRPMLRMTSLLGPVACGASWAIGMSFSPDEAFGGSLRRHAAQHQAGCGHSYTNELGRQAAVLHEDSARFACIRFTGLGGRDAPQGGAPRHEG